MQDTCIYNPPPSHTPSGAQKPSTGFWILLQMGAAYKLAKKSALMAFPPLYSPDTGRNQCSALKWLSPFLHLAHGA